MSNVIDEYRKLASEGRARLKVKGSVFQAIALPVSGVEEADEILSGWRRTYHDATHIGWARRLAPPPDGEVRWDDDGEPHGTTGLPILQAITGADLWGVQIGVARWFGGTKLGTGGLARAYGSVAGDAVKSANIKIVEVKRTLIVTVPNDLLGAVYSQADKLNAAPDPPEFSENGMRLTIRVRASMSDILAVNLREATAGRAVVEIQR